MDDDIEITKAGMTCVLHNSCMAACMQLPLMKARQQHHESVTQDRLYAFVRKNLVCNNNTIQLITILVI